MRALASQSSDTATPLKKRTPVSTSAPVSALFPQTASLSSNLIQRKKGCACGGDCPACQTKSSDLRVSNPSDAAEIEADHIADRVMRMPEEQASTATTRASSGSAIHRKCSGCEGEEETIQRKPLPSTGGAAFQSAGHVRDAISAGGRPLDAQTRGFFEPRLGYDLSRVRVHTDGRAAESARELNAHAYALGHDVVFGAGRFAPETHEGRTLIAHELAHVVQQGNQPGRIHRQQSSLDSCPLPVATSTYSRGNDDWLECDYETARMTVSLLLDTCACGLGLTMPLSLHYSAVLEGKSFTGRTIPNPSGAGTVREREGQASHIATGVVTPGRSRTPGPQAGLTLREAGLPTGTTNTSGTLRLTTDDTSTGGRPGDPGDTVSQELNLLGTVNCSGGSRGGQVTLANSAFTFQTVNYDITADRTGALSASVTLTEAPVPGRVPTPIKDVTTGRTSAVAPYGRFPGTPRPGGTGCTCDATTGAQVGTGCVRGTGSSGVGRGP